MVIDTSALFAIEFLEPEAERFDRVLRTSAIRWMSTASAVELMVALTRRRHSDQGRAVADLIAAYAVQLIPVDEGHMQAAWEGFSAFGQTRRHPARLNFGDCFSYALAKSSNLPLLFKGEDFSRTDVVIAAY